MPFEPIKVAYTRHPTITIDKYGRIRISKAALNELGWRPYQLVVCSVDADYMRIGLARQELAKVPNATPSKIDSRGYLHRIGRGIVDKLALDLSKAPFKFEYAGPVDDGGTRWYAFELVKER
jgi:hypothetical protein